LAGRFEDAYQSVHKCSLSGVRALCLHGGDALRALPLGLDQRAEGQGSDWRWLKAKRRDQAEVDRKGRTQTGCQLKRGSRWEYFSVA